MAKARRVPPATKAGKHGGGKVIGGTTKKPSRMNKQFVNPITSTAPTKSTPAGS